MYKQISQRILRLTLLVFTISASISLVHSQSIEPQVLAAGGEHNIGNSAQLSHTLGETIIQTLTSSTSILTQGFHQPETGNVGIEKWREEGWGLGIYPNPSAGQFTVQLNAAHPMHLRIINAVGQLIIEEPINKGHNYIDLSNFAAGMYLLSVYDDSGNYYGTYKLQLLDN